MDFPICDHLADYREQLAAAEKACEAVVAGIDRGQAGGRTCETQAALACAVAEWLAACHRLRSLLVELVKDGRVVMPRRKDGLPRCRVCRCAIRRLEHAEWEFAPDGSVRFRGAEFRRVPVGEPARGPIP